MPLRTCAAFAIAAIAVIAGAPASAAPLPVWDDDATVSVTVHYQRAELGTQAGAARLAQRIRLAAREVCGGGDPLARMQFNFDACRRHAIDRAIATLDAPLLADALGRVPAAALAAR